jgi:hypothetical protein
MAKDFVSNIRSTCFIAKITIHYFILKEKVKAGVNAVQILTLGAECYLQLIIKNSLGNTSTNYQAWQM